MKELLVKLPAVNTLADAAAALVPAAKAPRWALIEAARRAIAARRDAIVGTPATIPEGATEAPVVERATSAEIDANEVAQAAIALAKPQLRRVINATGVVLHTNLGRAPLATDARAAIDEVASGYTNLEYDLAVGERGSRHDHLRAMLCDLTGAEDAIVVNNNAAAMVLCLAGLAMDREIIVSRGELIEIGGSFRLPEILALSRGVLVEVGTTNKTHLHDYERAIRPATGMLLKVHRSNFTMVGFTSEVAVHELVELGKAKTVPTLVDLGSGALVDRDQQRAWRLPEEPTVAEAIATGADLVTFSGDKLVGGPQAGIVVGTRAAVEKARAHPLMRALRPDKLTLAGLAATLACYRDGRLNDVPVMRMLGTEIDALKAIADALRRSIGKVAGLEIVVEPCSSAVGGGAMPTAQLASYAVTVKAEQLSATQIEKHLRAAGIISRIDTNRVWLDVRTLAPAELGAVAEAVRALVK
ncbi:MAG TPA: L-seryl-tRNA(Sec) selenium transferase [Kofleriaceae bacterium]|jgi:L-seryl-tRNA(Ser) seleniumtransferase